MSLGHWKVVYGLWAPGGEHEDEVEGIAASLGVTLQQAYYLLLWLDTLLILKR
jgi:hypothetical protein